MVPRAMTALNAPFIQLNQDLLADIQSRLSNNPACDLSLFLKRQSTVYPNERSHISADQEQQHEQPAPLPPSTPNPTLTDIRIGLQITGDYEVLVSLDPPISDLLKDATLNSFLQKSSVLWQLGTTTVLALTDDIVVKIGRSLDVDISHVSHLQYIQQCAPGVPSPRVLGVIAAELRTYLFMTRMRGQPLDVLWAGLGDWQKTQVKEQLTTIMKEIRGLEYDGQGLGSGDPRKCKDVRRQERITDETICTEAQLNDFLMFTGGRKTVTSATAMLRSFLKEGHAVVMTHGDLHPRNVMVEVAGDEIKVTGLIDWEMCGWYPEYWEFVKSLQTVYPGSGVDDWWAHLPTDAIGEWPGEYALDLMVSRYVD